MTQNRVSGIGQVAVEEKQDGVRDQDMIFLCTGYWEQVARVNMVSVVALNQIY